MDNDDLEGIHPVHDVFFFGMYIGGEENITDSDIDADEDDSNAEKNWLDEYSDTDNSIDIDNEFSTDYFDEDEYDDYTKKGHLISPSDVDRYGLAYAKFKAGADMPELILSSDLIETEESFFYTNNDDTCSSNELQKDSDSFSHRTVELDE